MSDFSRRKFLKTGAAALAGITIAPSSIFRYEPRARFPNRQTEPRSRRYRRYGPCQHQQREGHRKHRSPCDVDWKYAKGVFDEFPNAKKYWDYRKMYDEMGKSIDGVIIATADHTHAIITADAMTMGKHVYCQKPLTHPFTNPVC